MSDHSHKIVFFSEKFEPIARVLTGVSAASLMNSGWSVSNIRESKGSFEFVLQAPYSDTRLSNNDNLKKFVGESEVQFRRETNVNRDSDVFKAITEMVHTQSKPADVLKQLIEQKLANEKAAVREEREGVIRVKFIPGTVDMLVMHDPAFGPELSVFSVPAGAEEPKVFMLAAGSANDIVMKLQRAVIKFNEELQG